MWTWSISSIPLALAAPPLVLPDAMGFDAILNYWDAFCTKPARLVAEEIDGKIAFTIDKHIERRNCDDMSVPYAFGIELTR